MACSAAPDQRGRGLRAAWAGHYLSIGQQMTFQKPVKIGDTLTVRLEILEKLPKFRVRYRHSRVQSA